MPELRINRASMATCFTPAVPSMNYLFIRCLRPTVVEAQKRQRRKQVTSCSWGVLSLARLRSVAEPREPPTRART